jgi:outer membrane protein assembly factor BamD (BamD/ComL family)
MARERFRRKDLKQPDEFVARGRDALEWSREHGRTVMQIGAALLVVALVVAGFFSLRAARLRQANEDLSQAMADYRAGQYAQAATRFLEVAQKWSSTPAGGLARLYAAQADLKADNAGNAVSLLEEARKDASLPAYIQQGIQMSLGFAAERSNDVAGAAARYQEAASMEGPFIAAALYEAARLRRQLGESAAATSLEDRLLNEFSEAPEANIVRSLRGQQPS